MPTEPFDIWSSDESESKDELKDRIGENVDRLITTDMGGRGLIHKLYPVARRRHKKPLALLAAESLINRVGPNDVVIITTGTVSTQFLTDDILGVSENDGPLGCAALARALAIGLGVKPIFAVRGEKDVNMMTATANGANLNVLSLEELKRWRGRKGGFSTASVIDIPSDDKKAKEIAKILINDFNPKAIIAIEKRGPNEKGIYHSGWTGLDISKYEAKIHHLFDEAKERGILSIGVGDGCGVEIGLGPVRDAIKDFVPVWSKCKCPCGGMTLDNTDVDITIFTSVCNWAGYGISACLAFLLDDLNILHNRDIELRMFRKCIDTGSYDGREGNPELSCGQLSPEIHAGIVEMLREIVKSGFRGRFHPPQ